MDAVFGVILLGVSLLIFVPLAVFHEALEAHWAPTLVWAMYLAVLVTWATTVAVGCSLLHIDLSYLGTL
jgi:hypothetical protein